MRCTDDVIAFRRPDPAIAWRVGGAAVSVTTKAGMIEFEWSADEGGPTAKAVTVSVKATIPVGIAGQIHVPKHRNCGSNASTGSGGGGVVHVVDLNTGKTVGGGGEDGIRSIGDSDEGDAVVVTVESGEYHLEATCAYRRRSPPL